MQVPLQALKSFGKDPLTNKVSLVNNFSLRKPGSEEQFEKKILLLRQVQNLVYNEKAEVIFAISLLVCVGLRNYIWAIDVGLFKSTDRFKKANSNGINETCHYRKENSVQ